MVGLVLACDRDPVPGSTDAGAPTDAAVVIDAGACYVAVTGRVTVPARLAGGASGEAPAAGYVVLLEGEDGAHLGAVMTDEGGRFIAAIEAGDAPTKVIASATDPDDPDRFGLGAFVVEDGRPWALIRVAEPARDAADISPHTTAAVMLDAHDPFQSAPAPERIARVRDALLSGSEGGTLTRQVTEEVRRDAVPPKASGGSSEPADPGFDCKEALPGLLGGIQRNISARLIPTNHDGVADNEGITYARRATALAILRVKLSTWTDAGFNDELPARPIGVDELATIVGYIEQAGVGNCRENAYWAAHEIRKLPCIEQVSVSFAARTGFEHGMALTSTLGSDRIDLHDIVLSQDSSGRYVPWVKDIRRARRLARQAGLSNDEVNDTNVLRQWFAGYADRTVWVVDPWTPFTGRLSGFIREHQFTRLEAYRKVGALMAHEPGHAVGPGVVLNCGCPGGCTRVCRFDPSNAPVTFCGKRFPCIAARLEDACGSGCCVEDVCVPLTDPAASRCVDAELKVEVSGARTTEGGGTVTLSVSLSTPPAQDVFVGLGSTDPSEGRVESRSLRFRPADRGAAQTVIVRGVNDDAVDGVKRYEIVVGPPVSRDPAYAGLDGARVTLQNLDDDAPDPTAAMAPPTCAAGLAPIQCGNRWSCRVPGSTCCLVAGISDFITCDPGETCSDPCGGSARSCHTGATCCGGLRCFQGQDCLECGDGFHCTEPGTTCCHVWPCNPRMQCHTCDFLSGPGNFCRPPGWTCPP